MWNNLCESSLCMMWVRCIKRLIVLAVLMALVCTNLFTYPLNCDAKEKGTAQILQLQ